VKGDRRQTWFYVVREKLFQAKLFAVKAIEGDSKYVAGHTVVTGDPDQQISTNSVGECGNCRKKLNDFPVGLRRHRLFVFDCLPFAYVAAQAMKVSQLYFTERLRNHEGPHEVIFAGSGTAIPLRESFEVYQNSHVFRTARQHRAASNRPLVQPARPVSVGARAQKVE
jgi:hypothetical protein